MTELITSSEFVSAILGAASALIVLLVGTAFKRQVERSSIRAAFDGEVKAMLALMKLSRTTTNLRAVIELSNSGLSYKDWPAVTFTFGVWEANSDKIGLLDSEEASQLAYFYTMHTSAKSMLKANELLEIEPARNEKGKLYGANRLIKERLYGTWVAICEMERVGGDFLGHRPSEPPGDYPSL